MSRGRMEVFWRQTLSMSYPSNQSNQNCPADEYKNLWRRIKQLRRRRPNHSMPSGCCALKTITKGLSHFARLALYVQHVYTNIFYSVAKSLVRQKMYASQECICNEHHVARTPGGITGEMKWTILTNNTCFLECKIDPAKCDRTISCQIF